MTNAMEEWILKELVKSKIATWEESQKGISTQAVWWVKAYREAYKELKIAKRTQTSD